MVTEFSLSPMQCQTKTSLLIYITASTETTPNQGNEKIKIAMSILTERDTGRQTDALDFRYFRLKTMQGNWVFTL